MESIAGLRVPACLDSLAGIRAFVRTTGARLGADPEQLTELVLAVDEAATNIVMHGDCEGTEIIAVAMARDGDHLVVQLTDEARPFDPTATAAPDLTDSPWERVGGLGMLLMRRLTDSMTYRRLPDGGNELTLVKVCPEV